MIIITIYHVKSDNYYYLTNHSNRAHTYARKSTRARVRTYYNITCCSNSSRVC
nr:MAG TPA: hypothetical protein [Microviridae sp.]